MSLWYFELQQLNREFLEYQNFLHDTFLWLAWLRSPTNQLKTNCMLDNITCPCKVLLKKKQLTNGNNIKRFQPIAHLGGGRRNPIAKFACVEVEETRLYIRNLNQGPCIELLWRQLGSMLHLFHGQLKWMIANIT